ncbi:hypothetical protein SAMN05414137_101199 [Streptacidiphilus jiangxiensis]|uniref:YbaB/EbfC DNA-binding family protein n=1 Tax=Streptacidiphilus jiangxiensis TaxID=235985 RepID=A0A1H7FHG9_STRJI|nr:hypothetical protein SAMN05414137_101199 [Streptacidiphilus jiangxiensis]
MRLSADGLPDSIRLESGWRQSARAGALASAVQEAAQLAMTKRMAAWHADLEQSGRSLDPSRGPRTRSAAPPAGARTTTPPAFATAEPASALAGRTTGALIEEVLSLVDSMDRPGAEPFTPPRGRGTAAQDKVTITLSEHALLSCSIDPDWTEKQPDQAVQSALSAALSAAKTALARNQQTVRASSGAQGRPELLALELLSRLGKG